MMRNIEKMLLSALNSEDEVRETFPVHWFEFAILCMWIIDSRFFIKVYGTYYTTYHLFTDVSLYAKLGAGQIHRRSGAKSVCIVTGFIYEKYLKC